MEKFEKEVSNQEERAENAQHETSRNQGHGCELLFEYGFRLTDAGIELSQQCPRPQQGSYNRNAEICRKGDHVGKKFAEIKLCDPKIDQHAQRTDSVDPA